MMEGDLKEWMRHLYAYLELKHPLLENYNSDVISPLDSMKAAVCDILNLFIQINDEDFEEYVEPFVQAVSRLLSTITLHPCQVFFLQHLLKDRLSTGQARDCCHQFLDGRCERTSYQRLSPRKRPSAYLYSRNYSQSQTETRRFRTLRKQWIGIHSVTFHPRSAKMQLLCFQT